MSVWRQDPSLSDRFDVRGSSHVKLPSTPTPLKGRRAFSQIMKDDASLNRKRNAVDKLMQNSKQYAWRNDLIMQPPSRHYMLDAKIKIYRRKYADRARFETNAFRKYRFSTNPEHLFPRRTLKELLREAKDIDAQVSYEPYDAVNRSNNRPFGWRRLDANLNVSRTWMARYRLLEYCKVRERGTESCSANELAHQIANRRVLDEEKLTATQKLSF